MRGGSARLPDILPKLFFDQVRDALLSEPFDPWSGWFISSRGNEYFCEIDEDYLTDRFNLTGLNADVQYYQYALDLVTDVFDLDCDDDMREQIEKSARHLYGLVHARYITTTRGLAKMVPRQVQKRRLRQMPPRPLRLPPAPPDRHIRPPRLRLRQTLLRPLRGPLQSEILPPRQHRRRLLRHLLHQHPVSGVPGARAGEEPGAV
ncbi:MAG: hypothetical protein Q9216_006208 [Gyalolechia sp. 2 TL-2023]